ncbi:MAG: peptidylprolyl isomerase [Pseudomonadota bacterium]|nr:peptidylprolyl isomerase [Pseudomonadota bacterium]
MKLLREPLVHFMLIGAAIYLLYGVFAEQAPEADDKIIVVSAGEVEWMQTAWQKRWNRPPTAAEFDGLMQQYIRETVLYREALTMGLNKHDQVIRRRLAQKLEFLAKDLVALTPPGEEDLHSYFEEHKQRYQQPALYTFIQVFIDPDKRGDATLDDAQKIKAELIARGDEIDDAGSLGDSFMLQNYYPQKDQIEIQKQFGSGFTESLMELTPGQWHGPVLSGYGVHLVYVQAVSEPPAPKFAEVRERVEQEWKSDKGEELNEQFYESLREQYSVVIEEPLKSDEDSSQGNEDLLNNDSVAALQEPAR